jgi:hypothetical protein
MNHMGLVLSIGITLLISGCQTFKQPEQPSADSSNPISTFLPIDPIAYAEFFGEEPGYFHLDDNTNSLSRDEELYIYPNEAVQVRILKFDTSGGVSTPFGGSSVKGGVYEVIVDYVKYRTDRGADNMVYQSGVGLRMRANISTYEADVNLSSLYGIGAAARAGQLSGTLRFETIGISGPQVSSLIPLPSEISVESIQMAMQAAAAIKSNLYDEDNVRIYPQVFGEKPLPPVAVYPVADLATETEDMTDEPNATE